MHRWTSVKEKASRDWIKTSCNEVDPSFIVMTTPFYFSSVQDFIGQCEPGSVATLTPQQYEDHDTKFIEITYLRYEDSITDGCDDDPVTFVYYNLQIYKRFTDVRGDATNSHDELIAFAVALRNKFLDDREHPTYGESLTRYPLTQPNNLQRRTQSEFLAGQIGDIINLQVKLEVR